MSALVLIARSATKYRLEEMGLIANPLATTFNFSKDSRFSAAYDSTRCVVFCTADLRIKGVVPTGLGTSVSSFYEQKLNPLGQEIFEAWIARLEKSKFSIQRIS